MVFSILRSYKNIIDNYIYNFNKLLFMIWMRSQDYIRTFEKIYLINLSYWSQVRIVIFFQIIVVINLSNINL